LEHFHFRSHLCIVTELLSINLYEMIKANSFVGFSTTLIRRFTHQLLASLQLMREKKIIHCDLKPEVSVGICRWLNDLAADDLPLSLEEYPAMPPWQKPYQSDRLWEQLLRA
jgi:hypothetical protein